MSAPASLRLLESPVARRLLLLFVLSAFLPLAVIALVSLTEVRALLLQGGEQRLGALAKSYGMGLFERLLVASDVALSTAGRRPSGANDGSLAARMFASLAILAPDGEVRPLLGDPGVVALPSAAHDRLAADKPVVVVQGSGDSGRLWLATASSHPAEGVVIGELKPEFLWGATDELPVGTQFCVVEEVSRLRLHCSAPGGEKALAVLGARGTAVHGGGTWTRGSEPMRARTWGQFMRAAFGTEDWIVVASQSESDLLERLLQFRQLYFPVMGLAIVLVIWLTFRQTRHIVQPVALLAQRARAIAANDFQPPLRLDRRDEFGELAGAFDHMTERLGTEFATLTALSEIDRLILASRDTADIVRTALRRLSELVAADLITVTLLDRRESGNARTFRLAPGKEESEPPRIHPADEGDVHALRYESGEVRQLDPDTPSLAYLDAAREGGMAAVMVQPISWRGEICGAIVLGFREPRTPPDEERRRVAEFGDRLAVAVSSAWRDEQLYAQAHFDALTGSPNRLLFTDRLTIEIARSRREKLTFALLFVDLDHFKNVNDSLGHNAGDEVLREAAVRISRCVRGSDTVARLGGDEFTVLLTNLNGPEEAWLIAETVLEALSREFTVAGKQCFLSASIGIATYPADGATAGDLLKSADTAMYRAKSGGRAQIVFFEERMNAEAMLRVTLDNDLRMAIERGEMVLHYQPIMDLRSGEVRAAEALLRWRHPTRGLISPTRFIPLAEESGFIEQIGQWTLRQTCLQAARWRAEGFPIEHISVNVSPRQFRKGAVVRVIQQCLEEASLPPAALQIEITEGLLVERGDAVEGMLHELAQAGHLIALDDFGTGFSSMSYLKRFPVHAIKIDRVFVDGLERSADSEAIVSAILALSHALGKKVIAEGVETREQLAILRRLECDEVQGFLVSEAVAAEQFRALALSRSRPLATA